MVEASKDAKSETRDKDSVVKGRQFRYLIFGVFIIPFVPFFYLQGQYTRWKVGRLPDAAGSTEGTIEGNEQVIRLLAIGESTVAGIGAENHALAFTGQFSKHLSLRTGKTVKWSALGESGITIERAINELVPKIAKNGHDLIVVALGANDVFAAKSPESFRDNMTKLVNILHDKNPEAKIFLANVPMVRDFLALPNPLKYVLSKLAKLNHFNMIELVSKMKGVFYFRDVQRVDDDFFSDGIHPSVKGYDLWTEQMVEFYLKETG